MLFGLEWGKLWSFKLSAKKQLPKVCILNAKLEIKTKVKLQKL
jgi:hypothetical protein